MDIRSYTNVRQNLASVMDEVCAAHAPVVVTRQNAASVVMMSLEEFNAIEETLHLLRSPRNAERLLRSIARANEGAVTEHGLLDEE